MKYMPTGKPAQNLLKLHIFGDKLNTMNMILKAFDRLGVSFMHV